MSATVSASPSTSSCGLAFHAGASNLPILILRFCVVKAGMFSSTMRLRPGATQRERVPRTTTTGLTALTGPCSHISHLLRGRLESHLPQRIATAPSFTSNLLHQRVSTLKGNLDQSGAAAITTVHIRHVKAHGGRWHKDYSVLWYLTEPSVLQIVVLNDRGRRNTLKSSPESV